MTLTRNALASVFQVAAGAALQFVLYRFILNSLGADLLGLWSIVLATSSASRIGELGLAAGVTRFVAKYRALEDHKMVASILQTAALSVLFLLATLMVVVFPLLQWLLQELLPASSVRDAMQILPYAVISLVLGSVAAVFQSGLDGCQRYDLRAWLVLMAQVALLCLVLWLVPARGLVGLAWAQIGQAALLLVAGWLMLRRLLEGIPIFPHQWGANAFREIFSYGAQYQLGAVAMTLFDPMTKALLGKFGGLSAAGYYELASKFVGTMRLLIVSANQVLVPVAASLSEREPSKLRGLYESNVGILAIVALPMYGLVAGWSPLVSELWLGGYAGPFVEFVLVLTVAWAINTFTSPAYFAQMGTGRIFWNTASHLFMGVSNAVFGYFLGSSFGATGVVSGMALALSLGSLVVVGGFHHDHKIPWSRLMPTKSVWLVFASGAAGLIGNPMYLSLSDSPWWWRYATCVAVPSLILLPFIWLHPRRKEMLQRVARLFRRQVPLWQAP